VGGGVAGSVPQFANTGSTDYRYYIVANNVTFGGSNPLYAGRALTNGAGNITVTTPDVTGASTFDLLRVTYLAPNNPREQAPYGTGNYAVAKNVTRASACANGVCTFTDTQATLQSYTVATPSYFPLLDFWPGNLILAANRDSGSVLDAATAWMQDVPSDIVGVQGTGGPAVISTNCDALSGWTPLWLSCYTSMSSGTFYNQGAFLLAVKPNQDGGLLTNLKGRLNFPTLGSGPGHIITLSDSNFQKTIATANNRPTNDANDAFIGYDQGDGNPAHVGISLGAPVSLSEYIGTAGDGTNWLERLTSGLKEFKTGVQLDNTLTVAGTTQASSYFTTGAGSWAVQGSYGTLSPALSGKSAIGFGAGGKLQVSENGGVVVEIAKLDGGGNVSENANTATQLAQAPTQCNGSFATGVQANGNANCSIADAVQLAETTPPVGIPNYGIFWFDTICHCPKVISNNGQPVQLGLLNVFNTDANTLEEYNGASPQVLNVYGARTDASNYERMRLGYDTTDGYFLVGTDAAGTGAQRGLGLWMQGSLRWVVDSSFNFKPWSDNIKDIGSPTLRPKHLYTGTYADLTSGSLVTEVLNEGTTGTAVNKLAKVTGSPATAIIASVSDTNGVIGIVVDGAGTTGSAQIARGGQASCVFDSATTAGDYVQISSTTAGGCHDAGATYPGAGQVLGRVLSTNASAGIYAMLAAGSEVQAAAAGNVNTVFGRNGTITAQAGDYSVVQIAGAAALASPAFTGTATAPTPGAPDNSTRIATTAWVKSNATNAGPGGFENTIYADQKCATPGTYDDSCLANALTGNNLHIVLPGNQDGTTRVYAWNNAVSLENVHHVNIDCDPNVLIQTGGSWTNSVHQFLRIIGGAHDITLNGHGSGHGGCAFDGTNVGLSIDGAVIAVMDRIASIGSMTQGTTCSTASGLPSTTVCATLGITISNWANLNDGKTYVGVYRNNPHDWDSAADLANCNVDHCPVTRKGPITFVDATHLYYSQDEHGNSETSHPAWVAGGTVQIAPYAVTVEGVEVKNGVRDGLVAKTFAGGPYALTANVTFRDNYLHDNANNTLWSYRSRGTRFLNNTIENISNSDYCWLIQSDMQSEASGNKCKEQWVAPGTSGGGSNGAGHSGMSTGLKLTHNEFSGGTRDSSTLTRPYLYTDTDLNDVITDNTFLDGGLGTRLEVSQGYVYEGNTHTAPGYAGLFANYRSSLYTLYSFDNIAASETNAGQYGNHTAMPPVCSANVTCTQDTAHDAQGTGSMAVTMNSSFTTGRIFYVNDTQNSGNTAATSVSYSVTSNVATIVFSGGTSNQFTAVPSLSGGLLANSITVTGFVTPSYLNGVWTVTATTANSVSFATNHANANGSDTAGSIVANVSQRWDQFPRRVIWIGTPANGQGPILQQQLLFCASSSLGLVNPEQCLPIPRTPTLTWNQYKLIDPHFGDKASGFQSWGIVCIANCASLSFNVDAAYYDIFQNEGGTIAHNSVFHSSDKGIWIEGGHHLSLVGNAIYDPGFGSSYANDSGVGIYLGTTNNSMPIDTVSLTANTITSTQGTIALSGVSAIKANCANATISNIFLGTNEILPGEWPANNAIQLGCATSVDFGGSQLNDAVYNLPVVNTAGVASAVDQITVTNSATGNPATVVIAATGADANINLNLAPKGTGAITAPTPATGDNSTKIATTAYVQAQTCPIWLTQPHASSTVNFSSTANRASLWGVVIYCTLATTQVTYDVSTADNSTNVYDIGIVNSSGTVVAHIGSTAGTSFAPSAGWKTLNWAAAATLPPGKYYLAITSSCTSSCAVLQGGSSGVGFTFAGNQLENVTAGGTLPGTITTPSDAYTATTIPVWSVH
jgi:hypothetical protein